MLKQGVLPGLLGDELHGREEDAFCHGAIRLAVQQVAVRYPGWTG